MSESVDAGIAGSTVSSKTAYEAWHERLAVDSNTDTPWHRLVKTHLAPARDLGGKRVLEIGCGRGGFACWLASHPQRPGEVVASDFAITAVQKDRKSTRLNSSHTVISYAVFCLKKKNKKKITI